MALISGSIPIGATFAPTGGTARTLTSLGSDQSSLKLLVNDNAAYSLRTVINVSKKEPTANAASPGGYTPMRHRINCHKPKLLADGSYFVNQIVNELVIHPETTSAEIDELLSMDASFSSDADFTTFWKTGSLT
jgi:hypothetical protein